MNAARSIIYAYRDPKWNGEIQMKNFAAIAGEAAAQMRVEINQVLARANRLAWKDSV